MRAKKVTIREIAVAAQVSVATVSLVLRNSPLVADKTRTAVTDAINALGYVYNRSAASMRSSRSGVIAISVTDLTNPYFAALTSSMERALNQLNLTVLLSDVRDDPLRQARFIEKMREHNVDGLLLCAANSTDVAQLMTQLSSAAFPCVLVSRNLPGSGLDYAGYDHRAGMRLAVEHLIALGHRRIALLCATPYSWVGRERIGGYREALAAHGLAYDPALELQGTLTRDAGFALVGQVLAMPAPPTAAACANDLVAFGVMLGLRHHGREPGRDFSVTGNDDVAEASLWTPSLTSVASESDLIGEHAAAMLLRRIEEPGLPPQHVSLPVTLRARASSCVRHGVPGTVQALRCGSPV